MSSTHNTSYKKRISWVVLVLLLIACSMVFHVKTKNVYADPEVRYEIYVNRARNCVTVCELNEKGKKSLVAMACSVAANLDTIPIGRYNLQNRMEWGQLPDNSCSLYCTMITDTILFTGSLYNTAYNGDLNTDAFNQLGNAVAQDGVIRLNDKDAKWIYDYCPPGTSVIIYDDEGTPGPLGDVEKVRIPVEHENAKWDPTDPIDLNPWRSYGASITGMKDIEINVGTSVDLMEGIQGFDICGNDITEDIIILGEYNLNVEGEYIITYCLVDAFGNEATQDITLNVLQKEETTITTTTAATTKAETTTNKETSETEKKDKVRTVGTVVLVVTLLAFAFTYWSKRD